MSKITRLPYDMNVTTFPGISAYGQNGPMGLDGDKGNNTYFSIYTNKTDIYNRILMKKSLNGDDTNVEYIENDLIIDAEGNIWKINEMGNADFIRNLFTSTINLNFTIEEVDKDDVAHPMLVENPLFLHSYSRMNSSPWIAHRDRYYPVCTGCWFKITVNNPNDSMNYTCGVRLPNGNIIKSNDFFTGEEAVCFIFIDHRYITDLHLLNNDELDCPIDGYKQGNCMFKVIKYNGVADNNECSKSLGTEICKIIKSVGIFFVEAESSNTGKIYRKEKHF